MSDKRGLCKTPPNPGSGTSPEGPTGIGGMASRPCPPGWSLSWRLRGKRAPLGSGPREPPPSAGPAPLPLWGVLLVVLPRPGPVGAAHATAVPLAKHPGLPSQNPLWPRSVTEMPLRALGLLGPLFPSRTRPSPAQKPPSHSASALPAPLAPCLHRPLQGNPAGPRGPHGSWSRQADSSAPRPRSHMGPRPRGGSLSSSPVASSSPLSTVCGCKIRWKETLLRRPSL